LNFTPINLIDVIKPVIEAHKTLAQENSLTLIFEQPEALPPVHGNYNQLSQVVDNLLTNAIKYSESGTIQVLLDYDTEESVVCLTVKDTGIGISEEDLAHLFDRYYRAKSVRQSTIPGTGLGLAIVRDIVQIHRGTIHIDSEPGVGTTVEICLPIVQEAKEVPSP
jgi:two-component system sensor histidine kinase VicK